MPPDSSETAGVAVRCCSIPMNSNMKRLVPHEGPAFFSLREILQNIWFSLLAIVSCNAILLFPFSTSGPRLFPAIKQERRQYSGPGILSLKYNREFCLKFPAFTKSRCRGIISIVDAHGSVIILIHAELGAYAKRSTVLGKFQRDRRTGKPCGTGVAHCRVRIVWIRCCIRTAFRFPCPNNDSRHMYSAHSGGICR